MYSQGRLFRAGEFPLIFLARILRLEIKYQESRRDVMLAADIISKECFRPSHSSKRLNISQRGGGVGY